METIDAKITIIQDEDNHKIWVKVTVGDKSFTVGHFNELYLDTIIDDTGMTQLIEHVAEPH